jgi:hypothetical protein
MMLIAELEGGVPDELRGAIKAFHQGDGTLPDSHLLLRETVRVLTHLIQCSLIREGEQDTVRDVAGERLYLRLLPWRATCHRVLDLLGEVSNWPPGSAARAELKRIVSRGWGVLPPVEAGAPTQGLVTHARDSPEQGLGVKNHESSMPAVPAVGIPSAGR